MARPILCWRQRLLLAKTLALHLLGGPLFDSFFRMQLPGQFFLFLARSSDSRELIAEYVVVISICLYPFNSWL